MTADQPSRIIVTGGAGFIGSALCRYLVAECGDHVLNVDKLTYAGNLRSLDPIAGRPNYQFVHADIVDRDAMQRVFTEFAPDAIVHLAAETHVDRSIDDAGSFIATNVTGTYVLLDVARAYWAGLADDRKQRFRFVMVSTDEVYGSLQPSDPAFSELTPYAPNSPYAASKAASDHLASAWHHTYGLPVMISNCSNNFGPYQFPEKLIPLTILNALEGAPIRVYGNGANIRDWLHVDDHARALRDILRLGRAGHKYNIGSRNERTNLDVVNLICDLLDEIAPAAKPRRSLITFVKDRPGHDFRYAIDAGKVERDIGWRPQKPFEATLRETIVWYMNNEAWWQPLRQNVYRGERLGGP